MPTYSTILGFPRLGKDRELKSLVEQFWAGKITESALIEGSKAIRKEHWHLLKSHGLDIIPSNDFSLYDHILDAVVTFGAIPDRFRDLDGINQYFAMARGIQTDKISLPSLPMSKFFDTNYHYSRVTLPSTDGYNFKLADSPKAVTEFLEAKELGIITRPAIIGPVSFVLLSNDGSQKLNLLPSLVKSYAELLIKLGDAGAEWVQLDEPHLVLELTKEQQSAYRSAYAQLRDIISSCPTGRRPKILVATYFEAIFDLDLALGLDGVSALHVDLVRGSRQITSVVEAAAKNPNMILSLGVVNGRNIWKCDLKEAIHVVQKAVTALGNDRVMVSSSCSLLHSPHSLDSERKGAYDRELLNWLSFSVEKVQEIVTIARAVNNGVNSVSADLDSNAAAIQSRRDSPRVHNKAVQDEIAKVTVDMLYRKSPYMTRRSLQVAKLNLPKFPTTTIGSFPQTKEVRKLRAQHKAGVITTERYEELLREEIERVVRFQEDVGIDVLVHGEAERNDMVEYFGEMLDGIAFSKNGWVQSYGSRGVKPPIIYGDISRPKPMTVRWIQYAQSLTSKPVKGMLTGPQTLLCWSFVRDDQPRSDTAIQLALAVRREVLDLEAAGISIIQIDEPAIREGLPLRRSEWNNYLQWAVSAFRLSSSGVSDATQIHSHMCYSDFEDIMDAIVKLDCDVLSMESAKSDLRLLRAFAQHNYPNELGPGVFDIHTPRVPEAAEMLKIAGDILESVPAEKLWINPDCGLKTRGWTETKATLTTMVEVARKLRNAAIVHQLERACALARLKSLATNYATARRTHFPTLQLLNHNRTRSAALLATLVLSRTFEIAPTSQTLSSIADFYGNINPATLSGAIDIVVVERENGELFCSPFHVRFGKLKLLRPIEKKVLISINGEATNLTMKVGEAGEAFFVVEAEDPVPSEYATSPIPQPSAPPDDLKGDILDLGASVELDPSAVAIANAAAEGNLSDTPSPSHRDESGGNLSPTEPTGDSSVATNGAKGLRARSQSERHPSAPVTALLGEDAYPRSEPDTEPVQAGFRTDIESDPGLYNPASIPVGSPSNGWSWTWGGLPVKQAERLPRVGGGSSQQVSWEKESAVGSTAVDETVVAVAGSVTPSSLNPEQRPEPISSLTTAILRKRMEGASSGAVDEFAGPTVTADREQLTDSRPDPMTMSEKVDSFFASLPALGGQQGDENDDQRSLAAERSALYDQLADEDGPVVEEISPVHSSQGQDLVRVTAEEESNATAATTEKAMSADKTREFAESPPSVQLSLCGRAALQHLVNEGRNSEAEEIFKSCLVSFETFSSNPALVSHPDLVVSVNGEYKDWTVAAPMILAALVFKQPLPSESLTKLAPPSGSETVHPPERPVSPSGSINTESKRYSGFSLRQWWSRGGTEPQGSAAHLSSSPTFEATATNAGVSASAKNVSSPGVQSINISGAGKSTAPSSPTHLSPPSQFTNMQQQKAPATFAKTLRLTSDQLKALNLRKGVNTITFYVTSTLQGTASCTSKLFYWDYDTKVVISDIDGTITKSDALGHLFTMVGKDWTHSGVASLFTNIRKNGYQLLYLTSRAIGQYASTRDYLMKIEQGSYQLPDGPVIMSPDRLFTALHREVIQRRPEVFKIAALRDIKSLFGPDQKPFYAGFGNRVTDAVSYRAVDVPPSRIFTIDPSGEVRLEQLLRTSYRSSYIKLNDIVDQIFPDVSGQGGGVGVGGDGYGDFEYWRTPVAKVDVDFPSDLLNGGDGGDCATGKESSRIRSSGRGNGAMRKSGNRRRISGGRRNSGPSAAATAKMPGGLALSSPSDIENGAGGLLASGSNSMVDVTSAASTGVPGGAVTAVELSAGAVELSAGDSRLSLDEFYDGQAEGDYFDGDDYYEDDYDDYDDDYDEEEIFEDGLQGDDGLDDEDDDGMRLKELAKRVHEATQTPF